MRMGSGSGRGLLRPALRWTLALFYIVAGWFHVTAPGPFLRIMPPGVPAAEQVVWWTGVAECAGAAAMIQRLSPALRRAGGFALAAYALCVFPANINHFALDMAKPDNGWGLAYHIPRMFAQPLIIWATLFASEATDWPFGRRARPLPPLT